MVKGGNRLLSRSGSQLSDARREHMLHGRQQFESSFVLVLILAGEGGLLVGVNASGVRQGILPGG